MATVVLAVCAAGSSEAQSADFQRTLSSGARPDVYISNGSGNVHVIAGTDGTVTIQGHVQAGTPHTSDVETRIKRILMDPPIQNKGNEIHIGTPADRSVLNGISIDYEVSVPREAALNLRTGSGDITVHSVGRFLAAQSGSGTIRAQGLHGPAELHTGSGDITLEQDGPGSVHADSSSGDLRLQGLQGQLFAHSASGDVDAAGVILGPGEIGTASGNIHLKLAAGTHLSVTANTGSGSIEAAIPGMQPSSEEHNAYRGQVHGGGPTLALHTGSGDIDIREQ